MDGREPVAIEPGRYPVVLDTYAVDDILEALSLYGMGAQAVQEGRSWMNDVIVMKDIPVRVILKPNTALYGAAHRAILMIFSS